MRQVDAPVGAHDVSRLQPASERKTPADARRTSVMIAPRQPGVGARLSELIEYRGLITYFGRGMLTKTYVRTRLGWLWIPLRPVMDIGTQIVVFGGILGAPSASGKPYPLFLILGSGVWQFFSRYLLWATRSIELNRRIVGRVYFSRLTLPLAAWVPATVDLLVYLAIFVVALVYYLTRGIVGITVGWNLLLFAPALLLALLVGFAISLWTSVLGANARDVRFSLGYILGFWYFLTPVVYPLTSVPSQYRLLASLNPMTAPVEMARRAVFGEGHVSGSGLVATFTVIVAVSISGFWYFGKAEAAAVDRL